MLGEFFADWQPLDPAGRGTLASVLAAGSPRWRWSPFNVHLNPPSAGWAAHPDEPSNPHRYAKR